MRSQDGWLRLVGEAFRRQVASYDSSGPFDLYSDKQDIITLQYRMCRRTNSLLQSINVFSLVLGVKKEYTENDTRPCAPTRKKKKKKKYYPPFHSTLHSTRPSARPRMPLYT